MVMDAVCNITDLGVDLGAPKLNIDKLSAIANGRDEGFTKLLFGDSPEAHGNGKILDIGKTIHPHPTLGESIGMVAEVAHGSRTDVPPGKK